MAKSDTKKSTSAEQKRDKDEESGKSSIIYYTACIVLLGAYCAYLYDQNQFKSHAENYVVLKPFQTLFEAVEQFSPFHEFITEPNIVTKPQENKT